MRVVIERKKERNRMVIKRNGRTKMAFVDLALSI